MLKSKNINIKYISIIIILAMISTLITSWSVDASETNLALNTTGTGYPQISASYTFSYDNVWEAVNGVISYSASPNDRWTAYESPNATDWLQVDFGSLKTMTQAKLYIYDDGGGVKAPSSYNVEYWNGSAWVDAVNQIKSPATPIGDAVNSVTFSSVSTQMLRVVFTHQSGSKSGVTEFEVYSAGGGATPTPTPTLTPTPTPTPGSNLALNISGSGSPQISSSYTFSYDNIWQAVNGVISYTDTPHDRWTAYESPNATDWLEVDFGSSKSVAQVRLYIYDDGGGVKAPSGYNVQHWNGSAWVNATNQIKSPVAPTGGSVNSVAFTSVNTQKIRVVFTHQSGSKSGITELEVFGTGTATPTPAPTSTPTATPIPTPTPTPPSGSYPQNQVSVISPAYRSSVSNNTTITICAPGMATFAATCWQQGSGYGIENWITNGSQSLDINGYGSFVFPANNFPHGPITVRIIAWKSDGVTSDTCWLQLYNSGGTNWNEGLNGVAKPSQASTMNLLFSDDFTSMPTISHTGAGATYCSRKPDDGEYGEAIFADREGPYNPFSQIDDYLRIRTTKQAAGIVDPMGWNRTYTTGFISSLRQDGTGIRTTGGHEAYFECRMMTGAAPGLWPAFWMLSANNYYNHNSDPCDEYDVIEGYGPDPWIYHTCRHQWGYGDQHTDNYVSTSQVGGHANISQTFHVYGLKMTESTTYYYFDNNLVYSHPTGTYAWNHGLYFMINGAIQGSFMNQQGGFSRYDGSDDIYVDWVRVYQN